MPLPRSVLRWITYAVHSTRTYSYLTTATRGRISTFAALAC